MIRLLTVAAMTALLASPVLAQSSSSPSGSTDLPQSQSSPSTGSTMDQLPGAQSQVPSDCLPNDPRPACQTAQMPSDQSPGSPSSPGYGTGSSTLDGQRSTDPNWQGTSPGSGSTR